MKPFATNNHYAIGAGTMSSPLFFLFPNDTPDLHLDGVIGQSILYS